MKLPDDVTAEQFLEAEPRELLINNPLKKKDRPVPLNMWHGDDSENAQEQIEDISCMFSCLFRSLRQVAQMSHLFSL